MLSQKQAPIANFRYCVLGWNESAIRRIYDVNLITSCMQPAVLVQSRKRGFGQLTTPVAVDISAVRWADSNGSNAWALPQIIDGGRQVVSFVVPVSRIHYFLIFVCKS